MTELCVTCGGKLHPDEVHGEHTSALDCVDHLRQRLAAAEARNAEASKALVLAWGGVCPLDWECDCTNWQMMAEQIRSRGDELQTRLAAAEAAARWCWERMDDPQYDMAFANWPWLADEAKGGLE